MEHGARSRGAQLLPANGTAGVWRRCVIDEAGGWQHDTLTEDTDLSYRAQLIGWKFLYLPDVECASELPVESGTVSRRSRRAAAAGPDADGQVILLRMMRSNESTQIKRGVRLPPHRQHQLPLRGGALDACSLARFDRAFLSRLVPDAVHRPAAVYRFKLLDFRFLYLTSQRVLYPKTWKRSILYMPLVMAVGVLASPCATPRPCWKLCSGGKSEFQVHTPKFKIEGQAGQNLEEKGYRNPRRLDALVPEIALGLYFAANHRLLHPQNGKCCHRPVPLPLLRLGFSIHRRNRPSPKAGPSACASACSPAPRPSRGSRLRLSGAPLGFSFCFRVAQALLPVRFCVGFNLFLPFPNREKPAQARVPRSHLTHRSSIGSG